MNRKSVKKSHNLPRFGSIQPTYSKIIRSKKDKARTRQALNRFDWS